MPCDGAVDGSFLRSALHLERKLFHVVGGSSVAVMGLLLDRPLSLFVLGTLAGLAVLIEFARLRTPALNRTLVKTFRVLLREREEAHVTGATYLTLAAFVCFAFFPPPMATLAVLFVSLGDPLESLVGLRVRGPRLFGKSPVGSLAFVAICLAIVGIAVLVGSIGFHWPLVAAASVGAVVELTPLPVDDNASVPVATGLTMALLGGL